MPGLLAGGMLVIGVSIVPFWKSLSPGEFQAWFASYSHLIGRLMIPLGVAGIAFAVAAAVAEWRGSATHRPWLFIAVASTIGVMVTYLVRGGLSDSAARSSLDRWATWHWIRTSLGVLGFVAALRALHR